MNKTLIIQSNLLIDTKKPDGRSEERFSRNAETPIGLFYAPMSCMLGLSPPGLEFRTKASSNSSRLIQKRDLTQIVTTSLPATGRRVGGYQTVIPPKSSCGQSGFNERSTNCSTGIYLPPKASPTQQFPVFD